MENIQPTTEKKVHWSEADVAAFDEIQSLDDYFLTDGYIMFEIIKKSNITAGGIHLPDSMVSTDMSGRYFPIIRTARDTGDLKGKVIQAMNLHGIREMFTIRGRRFGILAASSIYAYTTQSNLGIKLQ